MIFLFFYHVWYVMCILWFVLIEWLHLIIVTCTFLWGVLVTDYFSYFYGRNSPWYFNGELKYLDHVALSAYIFLHIIGIKLIVDNIYLILSCVLCFKLRVQLLITLVDIFFILLDVMWYIVFFWFLLSFALFMTWIMVNGKRHLQQHYKYKCWVSKWLMFCLMHDRGEKWIFKTISCSNKSIVLPFEFNYSFNFQLN